MYESFYGFREKPFNLTPDPKYLYLSPRHAEAFAHLEFGLRERGGFILITGEVGTGKTTLARYFLSKLGPETRTAVVLYPALSAAELLHGILDDLHVLAQGDTLKALVDALHRFLLESRAAGRDVVLLIDEAQALSPEVLEQVRLLSNLETDTEKLIQIVLMGQSELRDLLARHELRQLAQRVTARYHLAPLGLEETAAYVRHRLSVAGGEGKAGFTSDALRRVHGLSGGVPRLVNLVCDRALLAGYVKGTRTITAGMVAEAGAEVEVAQPSPVGRWRWRHGLVSAALALAVGLLAFTLAPRAAHAPAPLAPRAEASVSAPVLAPPARSATPAGAAPPSSNEARPPERNARLDAFLRTAARDDSYAQAIARLGAEWGSSSLVRTTLRTQLAQLRRLDLPSVLELFHPSRRDTCFVALARLGTTSAEVVAAGEALTLPLSQLEELWTRDAVVAWPEDASLRADAARLEAWARGALAASGYPGDDLRQAVRRFQEDAQLVSDGRLGPRTRMALFALAPGPRPRLGDGRSR